MIENILIIDTETTGLAPKSGAIMIEIAAILFNIKYKSILQVFSTLLPCNDNPVERINNIPAGLTQENYAFKQVVFENMWDDPEAGKTVLYDDPLGLGYILIEMVKCADACVAHNADFDKRFIATKKWGDSLLARKWICTKDNFTWPVKLVRLRLMDICEGMGVPYVNAHRALSDCLLLAQCFQKVDDLQERIDRC